MAEFFTDGPRIGLTEDQVAVLGQNMQVVFQNGLAQRHFKALYSRATFWERCASLDDPKSEAFRKSAERIRSAAGAELPYAFSIEPSNMSVSVQLIKVDPETGTKVDGSGIQVGLMGGLATDGTPNAQDGFTKDDLNIAVERLIEQKGIGLVYGMRDSSGFIQGY